ncbi:MAG: hypothetical protein AAF927_26400 [Bacteroidota bacterium]
MILRTFILILGLIPTLLYAQSSDYQQHIQTILRAHPSDSAFLEFVMNRVLETPADKMFLSNRQLLDGVCVTYCGRNSVQMKDTLKDGRLVKLGLKTTHFDTLNHAYAFRAGTDSLIDMIDSLPAYGAIESYPGQEIDTLWISIDGKDILIPTDAYRNLYDPNLCYNEMFHRAMMMYLSPEGEYLYVYLYGGSGANTYLAKLIFDEERFIKKIVTEYADLVSYDAYRWEFIGY